MRDLFKKSFLILLACSVVASAQPLPPPQAVPTNTLTWQDCVQMAVRSNPDLLSALQLIASGQAQYRGSFNGILPHLFLENSYNRNSSSHTGLLENGLNGTVTNNSTLWQLNGSASLDLIDVGQWASIQTASAQLHQNQANAQVTASNVLLNLYKAFAALMYAQEEIAVTTNIRDTWKSNAEMVSLRYDSGAESKGNKMNTEASFLQADASLTQARRDVQVAQQQLGQVIGKDQFEVLAVTGTWAAPPAPNPVPDLDALIPKQPQVLVQQAVVEQARAGIRSAKSTLFPTLSLNYSKGRQGATELPSDPFWTFSGTLRYPLFGNGLTSTYYAVQAAQRAYDKAQQDLRSLKNQTRSNLISAWSAYGQAEDALKVQRAFLDASTQRKGESDINYQSGLMTFENWILIVDDFVNAQTSYLRAEQALTLAEAQWRFAIGEQIGEPHS
jgi:outer membrane protein TolC